MAIQVTATEQWGLNAFWVNSFHTSILQKRFFIYFNQEQVY